MDIFPKATDDDITKVRSILQGHVNHAKALSCFDSSESQLERRIEIENYQRLVTSVEKAVNMIADDEVRSITQWRFIKGYPRKSVIVRFNLISERSVDRKINEGIVSVANILKLWGEL